MNNTLESNTSSNKSPYLKLIDNNSPSFLNPYQRQQIAIEIERLNCLLAIKNKYKLVEKICQMLHSLMCTNIQKNKFDVILSRIITGIHNQTWSASKIINDKVHHEVLREIKNLKNALKDASINFEHSKHILNNARIDFNIDEVIARRQVAFYASIIIEIKSRIKTLSICEYRINKIFDSNLSMAK